MNLLLRRKTKTSSKMMNEDSLLVLNSFGGILPAFGNKLKNVRGFFNNRDKEIPEILVQPPTPKGQKSPGTQIDTLLAKSIEKFHQVLKRRAESSSFNKKPEDEKSEKEKLVKSRSLGCLHRMDYLQVPRKSERRNRHHSMPCLSKLTDYKPKQCCVDRNEVCHASRFENEHEFFGRTITDKIDCIELNQKRKKELNYIADENSIEMILPNSFRRNYIADESSKEMIRPSSFHQDRSQYYGL